MTLATLYQAQVYNWLLTTHVYRWLVDHGSISSGTATHNSKIIPRLRSNILGTARLICRAEIYIYRDARHG